MFPINEIFHSLQGEGYNTGTASVFLRFSGCNLHCHFCDTQHLNHTMMSLPQLVEEVMKYPSAPLIVLTGGEPSLYVDEELIKALKLTGKRIAIETNGTRLLPRGIDWITLSPKQGFEGGDINARHRYLQPCFVDDERQRELNIQSCVNAVLTHPTWRLSLQTHRLLGIR